MGRSRIYYKFAAEGVPFINLYRAPYNAELIQWQFTTDSLPTNSENFAITITDTDIRFNITLLSVDLLALVQPTTTRIELLCNEVYQLQKSNYLRVEYPNSDAMDCYFTLIFREVT